jgi:hypothetical protein
LRSGNLLRADSLDAAVPPQCDLGDRQAFQQQAQHFALVAAELAAIAGQPDVRWHPGQALRNTYDGVGQCGKRFGLADESVESGIDQAVEVGGGAERGEGQQRRAREFPAQQRTSSGCTGRRGPA